MNSTNRMLVGIVILLLGFVLTFLAVYSGVFLEADTSGFSALNRLASSQAIADLAIIVTYFGSELILIPLAGLIYLLSKSNKLENLFLVVLAVAVSEVILILLKASYFRPRPASVLNGVVLPWEPETDSSFPSGHTTRAFAVASLLLLRTGRKYAFLVILAIGVALSRIVLGVHFPLDVLGGAFLGTLLGLLSYEFGPRIFRYVFAKLFPGQRIP